MDGLRSHYAKWNKPTQSRSKSSGFFGINWQADSNVHIEIGKLATYIQRNQNWTLLSPFIQESNQNGLKTWNCKIIRRKQQKSYEALVLAMISCPSPQKHMQQKQK